MRRYLALRVVSWLLVFVGWVTFVAGLYFLYDGFIEPMLPNHTLVQQDVSQRYTGVGALIFGLVVVAIGEAVRVIVAIERNTREAAESTEELLRRITPER